MQRLLSKKILLNHLHQFDETQSFTLSWLLFQIMWVVIKNLENRITYFVCVWAKKYVLSYFLLKFSYLLISFSHYRFSNLILISFSVEKNPQLLIEFVISSHIQKNTNLQHLKKLKKKKYLTNFLMSSHLDDTFFRISRWTFAI